MAIQINTIYRDLGYRASLTQSGDINVVENQFAVKQSIITIINTPKGTRLFEPEFGCDVRRFLFEPMDSQTSTDIKDSVKGSIGRYEPRVEVVDVNVITLEDVDGYNIDIIYKLRQVNLTDSISVNIQRL